MSDSSCSNCNKECEFSDFSCDCYKQSVEELQTCLSKEDYENIKTLKTKLKTLYEIDYIEELRMGYEQLENIINLYEGK